MLNLLDLSRLDAGAFELAVERVAVAEGLSNKEIAADFELSLTTVEDHISRILEKKQFVNRIEVARHMPSRRPS